MHYRVQFVLEPTTKIFNYPGILDSDVDPVNLTYIIPGNDDSTDSILLYHKLFASSILRAKTADTLISHSNHPGRLGKQAAGGTGAGIVRR